MGKKVAQAKKTLKKPVNNESKHEKKQIKHFKVELKETKT